jgi:hypothetical protein
VHLCLTRHHHSTRFVERSPTAVTLPPEISPVASNGWSKRHPYFGLYDTWVQVDPWAQLSAAVV